MSGDQFPLTVFNLNSAMDTALEKLISENDNLRAQIRTLSNAAIMATERAELAESRLVSSTDVRYRILQLVNVYEDAVSWNKHAARVNQKHLDAGSEAQAYWQHGYLMALRDVSGLFGPPAGKSNH